MSGSEAQPLQARLEAALAEQRELTAVERFAQRHADEDEPLQERYYRDLLPTPADAKEGLQLGFRVDLDRCTGCKACVTACHNMNGLRPEESWRMVGELATSVGDEPQVQTITTACHHCVDPACLRGCPAKAYEQDPATGIVIHLDDQCIGCQYCLLECPYDAPQYNIDLGIVRKCDLCVGRLSSGEAPACVQGCPTMAISIDWFDPRSEGSPSEFLDVRTDAVADARLTRPTTRYDTTSAAQVYPNAAAAMALHPSEGHTPLVFFLVLIQLSFGVFVVDELVGGSAGGALLASACAGGGLLAALAHLGRPMRAYRAVLGWRTSWMSREVLFFGGYGALVSGTAGARLLGVPGADALATAAGLFGTLGTISSILLYADTGRPYWTVPRAGLRFVATLVLLGAGAGALLVGPDAGGAFLSTLAAVVAALKLGWEAFDARPDGARDLAIERSAQLLRGALRDRQDLRLRTGWLGVALMLLGALFGGVVLTAAGLLALIAGELQERSLFFRAEAMPGMPGA